MNDFNRCNRVTGIQWLKNPIRNLRIYVELKPKNSIAVPHSEDFTDPPNSATQHGNNTENYTFKWQQKVFSVWELQRYSDVHHCITDTELNYNDMINDLNLQPNKIFTYTHEDNFLPTPTDLDKSIDSKNNFDILALCMDKLNIQEKLGKFVAKDTVSMGRLFKSEENIGIEGEQWMAMHVMMDNSEYNEDFQLLLKQEATLLSLYYNSTKQCLIVSPDVNNLEWNPYTVETSSGVRLNYQYSVDLSFEDDSSGCGKELSTLLQRLSKKWQKKNKQLLNFGMPPLGKKQVFITLEILSASGFDVENKELYVEFYVKFPEGVKTNDVHHGRTHTSRGLSDEEGMVWSFSHLVELHLEADVEIDIPPIQIFFEAISTDWWSRHRTEGYSSISLTTNPGCGTKLCASVRPEENETVEAESRRFFVGGCHLIKELDVLTKPKMQDSNFRYVSTGSIAIRWTTILQSYVPGTLSATSLPEHRRTSASALLLGAEAVLRQYKKARARLHAATEGLGRGKGEGDG